MGARNLRQFPLIAVLSFVMAIGAAEIAFAQDGSLQGIQEVSPPDSPLAEQPVQPIAPTAPPAEEAVDGICGGPQGAVLASVPVADLCHAGTPSTVTGLGPWSWSCAGRNGGRTAFCWADKTAVDGACGPSNGGQFTGAPAVNLCSAGTATSVSGSGPWWWGCQGSNGGTDASCGAALLATVTAACGTANGTGASSVPTVNLCSTGTPSSVSGTGPWTWSCAGTGASVSCSTSTAFRNGQCGSAGGMISNTAPTGNLCAAGTPSAVTGTGPWAWTCGGVAGGTTASCGVKTVFDPADPVGSGYHLTFDDEFDSLSAALPPATNSKWETNFWYRTALQSNYNWLPLDPAVCNLGLSPYSINDGFLTIQTRSTTPALQSCGVSYPYTSGHLDTYNSFAQEYGYFETRAKVSNVFGTMFAFWLLPEDGSWPPEIDAPEILSRLSNTAIVTNHTNDGGFNTQYQFSPTFADLSNDFHTYGVLWTANTITWYVDGQQIGQTPTRSDEHKPFFMILEFGVGGCNDGWADCPASLANFSASAQVDWVHVWGAN